MRKGQKKVKSHTVTGTMLLPVLAWYLMMILIIRFSGEQAPGLMIPASSLYLAAECALMIAVRKRVYRFVRIYNTNGYYINAKESSRNALFRVWALIIPVSLVLAALARILSNAVCGAEKARLPLYAAALCAVAMGLEGVLAGFAEGMGKKKTMLTLDLLRAALIAAVPPLCALPGRRYGEKLDALLYTTDSAALYALLFAFGGLFLTEMFITLLLLVVRVLTLKKLEPLHETGKPRYLGEPPALFGACAPFMLACVMPFLVAAVCCAALCAYQRAAGTEAAQITALCGSFFGRFLQMVFPVGILAVLPYVEDCYRISGVSDDVDMDESSGRYRYLMHRQSILFFPVGLFVMALAEPLQTAVFGLPDDTASLMTGICGLAATFTAFYLIVCMLLVLTKRRAGILVAAGISGACGMAAGIVLIRFAHAGAPGAAIAVGVFLCVFVCIGITGLNRLFSQRAFLRGVIVKPLLLSAVCALVMYLLSSFLVHVIGDLPTCIVCIAAGGTLYLTLMAFFRGFVAGDLAGVPFGRLFTGISLRGTGQGF